MPGDIQNKNHGGVDADARARIQVLEQRLRASETASRAWLEHSPVCTKIVDPDFNLQYMSAAGVNSLNIEDVEEFYGKPYPFSFYPESFKQEMAGNLKRASASGEVVTQEAAVCDVDGNELWFHSTIVPVPDSEGRLDYLMVVSLETTERKQAEMALQDLNRDLESRIKQRTAQVEAVNEELKGFTHNVSHDLRAPLRNISSFVQLLNRKYGAGLDEQAARYLGHITDGAAQMDQLIEDLLKFSRLGRGSITIEPISLDEVFEQAAGSLSSQLEEAGAEVKLGGPMPGVMGSKNLVTHAVINVLENAVKYREPDTPLVITVDHEVRGGTVAISISDNGLGIAPEFLQEIFKAFRRLHSQSSIPGSGIGLASVRKALGIMKGKISVKSEPGQGSTFIIELPAATLG